jgi:hypothetical protein
MSNVNFKGIDVKQTGESLLFDAYLLNASAQFITVGPTYVSLYELQNTPSLKSFDYSILAFVASSLTTETATATYCPGNNSATDTGLWLFSVANCSGFTNGGIYYARFDNASAFPVTQYRKFQYGSAEGDLLVTSSQTGQGLLQCDVEAIVGNQTAAQKFQAQMQAQFLGIVSGDQAPTITSFSANTSGSPGLNASSGFYSTPSSIVGFYSGVDSPKCAKIVGYTYNATGDYGVFTLANPGLLIPPAIGTEFILLGIVI